MQGTVVSDHGDKTIVVQVERRFKHPLLNKIVRKSKRFMAHDENNTHKTGDTVHRRMSALFQAQDLGSADGRSVRVRFGICAASAGRIA